MHNDNKVIPYTEVRTTEKNTEMQFSDQELLEDPDIAAATLILFDSTRFYSAKDDADKYWILRQSDPWRVRWDLFVMLCAVYNCFVVPYEIAFMHDENLYLIFVSILVDIAFSADIVFNFRTTYLDHVTGDEIFDPRKISHHYIRSGHLLLDIVATVPFDYIIAAATGVHDVNLKLTTLLKLIHIMRLSKIINNIRLSESFKIVIRLLQIILSIVMFVHCIGCAWYSLVELNKLWMPPSEGLLGEYYEAPEEKKYSFSLYHAVYMWAGVEINPQTNLEMFFLIIVILVGSIIRAVLFGKMAVLMSNLSKDAQNIASILDTANTSMKNMQLPEKLQLKICDYLLATQHTLAQQEKFEQFMQLIPPTQQNEVGEIIYAEIATVCPVLRKIPSMFKPLIQQLHMRFIYPETNLIVQGDQGDKLYYLVNGKCEVEVFDEHKQPHIIKHLMQGKYFGELALLYNTTRTATVRSVGYSTIGELGKSDFIQLTSNYPDAIHTMKRASKCYKDPWKAFVTQALRRVPYFKNLPDDVITLLMYSLHSKSLDSDTMLFTEGSVAENLYIVAEGSFNIYFDFKTKTLQGILQEHYCSVTQRDSIIEGLNASQKLDGKIKREKTVLVPKSSKPYSYASMKLEYATVGNILCASQAVMRADMKVNCIATEPSLVLYISTSEIEELMRSMLPLKHEVEFARSRSLKFDTICGEVLKIVPPIDFTRSYVSTPPAKKNTMLNIQKLKNAVISLLLRKRQAQISGLENIKSMVLRLKAMMKAESAGFISLARKIASGEVCPEAVEAIGVLNEDELKNPLLTQFALKVQSIRGITTFLEDKMMRLATAVEPQQSTFEDIHSTVGSIRNLVEELERCL